MYVMDPAVSIGFVSGGAVGQQHMLASRGAWQGAGVEGTRDGDTREAGLQEKGYFPAGAWSPAAPQPPALGSSLKANRIRTLFFLVPSKVCI